MANFCLLDTRSVAVGVLMSFQELSSSWLEYHSRLSLLPCPSTGSLILQGSFLDPLPDILSSHSYIWSWPSHWYQNREELGRVEAHLPDLKSVACHSGR